MKLHDFTENVESMVDEIRFFIHKKMSNDGCTCTTSQQMCFLQQLNEIDYLCNGTEQQDLLMQDDETLCDYCYNYRSTDLSRVRTFCQAVKEKRLTKEEYESMEETQSNKCKCFKQLEE